MAAVNPILEQLRAALAGGSVEKPPDGFETRKQIAASLGVSETTVRRMIEKGIPLGLFKKSDRTYKVDGRNPIWLYKINLKKK